MTITVWTWPELSAAAGGPRQAERWLREKQVWRVMQGAYVGAEHADSPEVRLAALARVAPDHAVLFGLTALWALGLDLGTTPEPVEIAVPRGKQLRKRDGVRVRSMHVDDAELVALKDGRLAVSPSRAVVDVARERGIVEGVAHADAVLRAGLSKVDLIEGSIARAHGLRGVVRARRVVPHLEPRSESLMESRLRMVLVLAGLPRPEAQVDFYADRMHAGRVDLYLQGVAFEYDGFDAHDRGAAFGRDRRRANDLSNGGLVVSRFTSEDYYTRPRRLITAAARSALAQAAGRNVTLRRGPDTLRPSLHSLPLTLAETRQRAA